MSLRIPPDAIGRPVEDIARVSELVLDAKRTRRELYGKWAPEDSESERVFGIWRAILWLDDQPCGPFTDGPATLERLRSESAMARRVVRGSLRSRYTPSQALGIAQLLDYARGATDTIPGFVQTTSARAAA